MRWSFLPCWIERLSGAVSRGRRTPRSSQRRCPLRLDVLEDRWLLSTILWNGNAGDGNWSTAENWVGGVLPGAADDAVIDNTSPPVTITLADPVTVRSLTSTKDLVVQGTLTVTAGPSSVSGALTLETTATLGVDGRTTSLTATGPTTLNAASLSATRGGRLSLPQATTYGEMEAFFSYPFVRADGVNSFIDLSHVTQWRGASASYEGDHVTVQASNGSTVDLAQLTAIAAGNTSFEARDDGHINLTALTSFAGEIAGGANSLIARRGGAIVAPALTDLSKVDLNLGGHASLPIAGLTTFRHGSVFVFRDGNQGGELALPLPTIDETGFSDVPLHFSADGLGSRLDLSRVTTWRGQGSPTNNTALFVAAANSATVDLSQVATISAGNTSFNATDDGQVNLTALTSFTGASHHPTNLNRLLASHGGAIVAPALSSLTNVDLNLLSGPASLPVAGLVTFQHGSLWVFNAELALPVTTIDESGATGPADGLTFRADGTGSRLDLSRVTTWRGAGGSAANAPLIDVTADRGTVDLSQVATIDAGNTGFHALEGGQINLTSLTSFTGASRGFPLSVNFLSATDGGAIVAPSLTSLTRVDLSLGSPASLPVSHLTSFTQGQLFASGGATLSLPVTTIDETDSPLLLLLQANGPGSRLDLSHVTTLRGAGSPRIFVNTEFGGTVDLSQLTTIDTGTTTFRAWTGGTVDLSRLATVEAGNITFQATSMGSRLNLTALAHYHGADPTLNNFEVNQSGTLVFNPKTTVISNSTISLGDGTGVLTAGTLQLVGGSRLIGFGTVTANLVNDAEVQPDNFFNALVITGNYTQTGDVTGTGTLTVNGLLAWAGGSMGTGGTVNANGGLSISGDTTKTLDGRTLNDNGSGTWTGLGNLDMGHGAALNLLGSATLDIQNDQAITNTLGGTATVNNAGLLKKSAGTGTTAIQVNFANTGTVQVDSGALSLTGAFSNFSGSTLTGGTYVIASTFQFPGADIVTNAATIVLNGASSRVIDQASADGLRNFATNAAVGSFTVQNGRNFTTAGDFTNTGNLTLGPGSMFRVTGNYIQDPTGTLEVQLGDVPASGQFGQLVVSNQATLNGTLQIDLVNGYPGNPGDTFTIVTFGSRSGDFTTLNLAGSTWNPDDGTVRF
jgi:hypothetical protein